MWMQKECLYIKKCPLHYKHDRIDALDAIAMKMSDTLPGVTNMEIKTIMNYLRSQYGRELIKIQDTTKSDAGTDDLYVPSAYWFQDLDFLKDFVFVRKEKSNLNFAFEKNST